MKLIKIYLAGVAVSYISIALMCVIFNQPLIYLPIRYDLPNFLNLLLLMASLNFGLFLTLGLLNFLNHRLFHLKENLQLIYYELITLFVLFLATLIFGYTETILTRKLPDPLYYYTFSNNSWIYLVCGFVTDMLVSFKFAKRF